MKKLLHKKTKYIALASLAMCCSLATTAFADDSIASDPWFTGPLLGPSGNTIPKGHVNIEPYLFVTDDYGFYNSFSRNTHAPSFDTVSPTLLLSYGLTDWMDVGIALPYNFNSTQGIHSSNVGDTSFTLGFQVLKDKKSSWIPALRLTVAEAFPSGTYDNLDPSKLGADATGTGSYQTTLGANFQKLYYLVNGQLINARLSFTYTLPSRADISGLSSFGGASDTNGEIRYGGVFNTDLGLEYTLTHHWVPALDIVYTSNDSGRFTGFSGTTNTGLPAPVSPPTSGDLVSLAPAIEYNFNSHIGVIAGTWFSVYGRDKPSFVSGVMAINFYY